MTNNSLIQHVSRRAFIKGALVTGGGMAGAGYLGPKYEPFHLDRTGRLPYFTSGLTSEETQKRRGNLLEFMEEEFGQERKAEPFESHRLAKQRSWRLLRAKDAFDVSKEWP